MSRHTSRTIFIGGVAAATGLLAIGLPPSAMASTTHYRGHSYVCTGGSWASPAMIPSGTYRSLQVRGICEIPAGATVTVQGNVVVRPRGVLNAITSATVHIQGSAYAERGSILALGCTAEFGCTPTADQKVSGSVIGSRPLAIYLNGTTVRRNLLVYGGGPGVGCVDTGFPPIGHDLPIKDNTIGGNVVIDSWAGCWAGMLRNTIGGSVDYSRVKANTTLDSSGNPVDPQGPDSNEIVGNTIRGALVCWGNTPAPQFGDAGVPPYATNHAGWGKWGQCAKL